MTSRRWNSQEQPAESRIDFWHFNATVQTGNALALSVNTLQVFGFLCLQNVPAINDSWLHPVYLKRGTYTISLLGAKVPNGGILTLSLTSYYGQVWSNTFDLYAAANTFGSRFQDTAVSVTRDDFYQLTGSMLTKNPSSSAYACYMNLISLYRTGD